MLFHKTLAALAAVGVLSSGGGERASRSPVGSARLSARLAGLSVHPDGEVWASFRFRNERGRGFATLYYLDGRGRVICSEPATGTDVRYGTASYFDQLPAETAGRGRVEVEFRLANGTGSSVTVRRWFTV